MTWKEMAADLVVRGFPQMAIHFTISVSGVSAHVRRPTLHAYQRDAARCGRQRILEPPATPAGETTEVKNRNSRRFDLPGQSLPRELDWAGG